MFIYSLILQIHYFTDKFEKNEGFVKTLIRKLFYFFNKHYNMISHASHNAGGRVVTEAWTAWSRDGNARYHNIVSSDHQTVDEPAKPIQHDKDLGF